MSRDDILRCMLRQAALLLGAAAGVGLAAGRSEGQAPAPAVRSLDLDSGWRFRQAGTERWRRATVPGTVQTDLLADSIIPDPFYRDDEAKLQWVGLRDWEYARQFDVPAAMLRQKHLLLVFQGLDTYARILLNGQPVLRADNMFRTWTVDMTGRLRPGANRLDVQFRSPIPIEDSAAAAYPYKLPAGNDPHATRVFTRKAGYHYGWDWGPRFVTQGIWRPVRLVAWSRLRLDDAFIEQRQLTDTRATLRAHVSIRADTALTGTLTVSSPDGAFPTARQDVRVGPGTHDVALDFTIPKPRRWWPNGLGPHPLYTIAIALSAGGVRDTLSRRIGLRTLELVQRPDAYGTSFTFRVNGVPVFMKGANYIPQDNFTPRVDSARYAALFRDVVDSHMNMLRVWGGGIYERDLFYRMADENGILLWQEFMFANGMYPVTPAFLANVRVEAEQQVRRLRNHPSLALWCGNNEIHEGWDNWGWQKDMGYSPADSAAVWAGYVALFQKLLPGVVDSLDPGVSYWETSPSMGWGHAGAMAHGDSHYWGVWGGEQPFDTFRQKLPRFMSEFGFQAYPSMRTIAQFTLPADRALGTPVMKAHQKNIQGDSTIERYMRRWFPAPKDFASFVYLSQVLQAEGMKVAFEAERSAMPRTMGSLYWQLDDSWPVVSWSSRDYYGRWKAMQYYVRRAFAPVLVAPALDGDDVQVHIVSDLLRPVRGVLTLRTLRFRGGAVFDDTLRLDVPADTSDLAVALPIARMLAGADPADVVVVAELRRADGEIARNLLYLRKPRELRLPRPGLEWHVRRDGAGIVVDVRAMALARDVSLEFPGVDGHFSDDFFDLLPGERRSIRFQPTSPVKALPPLVLRSLVDAFVP